MKIGLKYGLMITAVVIAWVIIAHFILDLGAESRANLIGPILFNVTAIVAILLGLRARKEELRGKLSFKEGLRTGMKISLVYAVSACLFFMIAFLVVGPKLLQSEAGPQSGPIWKVAAGAFAGLFFGSLISGLIYSTIISFILARRLPREPNRVI